MRDYKDVVRQFYEVVKDLCASGASMDDARLIAAQLVGRAAKSLPVDLLTLKSQDYVVAYRFRGTRVDVQKLWVAAPTRSSGEQLKVQIQARVQHRIEPLELKSDQAFRLVALMAMKFRDYERDVGNGFSAGEIEDYEGDMAGRLQAMGYKISRPSITTVELMRTLKNKFADVLHLENFISDARTQRGYRLEIPAHHLAFTQSAAEFLNQIAEGAVDRWFERYQMSMSVISQEAEQDSPI